MIKVIRVSSSFLIIHHQIESRRAYIIKIKRSCTKKKSEMIGNDRKWWKIRMTWYSSFNSLEKSWKLFWWNGKVYDAIMSTIIYVHQWNLRKSGFKKKNVKTWNSYMHSAPFIQILFQFKRPLNDRWMIVKGQVDFWCPYWLEKQRVNGKLMALRTRLLVFLLVLLVTTTNEWKGLNSCGCGLFLALWLGWAWH